MKAVSDGDSLLKSIVKVIHAKCDVIGRPWLQQVGSEDIKKIRTEPTGAMIVYVRGMSYRVDLNRETFGIFDPATVIGQRGKPRLGRTMEI